MSSDDKGKFEAGISNDVINAALKSVEKREAKGKGVEVTIEPPTAAPAVEAAGETALDYEAEYNTVKAQLELSQTMSRDLRQKYTEEHDKLVRASADLDNFKKRAAKEREEVSKFGNEKLLKDLLPVLDNLDRAIDAAKAANDFESLKKGVEMTRRLFEDQLAKYGVKSFSAKGQPFDPALHEAMSQAESAELPPNHVVSEMVRGFTLNDRLIRPALVVVSKAPETGP